jgi:hypothetical protein
MAVRLASLHLTLLRAVARTGAEHPPVASFGSGRARLSGSGLALPEGLPQLGLDLLGIQSDIFENVRPHLGKGG